MPSVPKSTRALVLRRSKSQKTPPWDDAVVETKLIGDLKPGEVLLRMGAVAFNRRDVWIRLRQYPGIGLGAPFGSDGAGTVIASADPHDALLNQRVFMTPMRGWKDHPEAPESTFTVIGASKFVPVGTFAEHVVVSRDEVIRSPSHLSDTQTAAWPLGGLTAWRACIVNAKVKYRDIVFITGIGGGVALFCMQLCLAKGAVVYVSSGSEEKIKKAIQMGAKGGVNYKAKDWPAQLGTLLKKHATSQPALLDAVIDAGGGDLMTSVGPILRNGGRVVCYGMTASPKITFTMREVMRNQQLIGSTMGSRADLVEATEFLTKYKIVPVVSHVLGGLDNAEQGFELMKKGDQFGKIVINLEGKTKAKL